jgi:osmotically-inducible protein OsmY
MIKNIIQIISILFLLNSCMSLVSMGIVSLGISAAKDKTIGESLDDAALSAKIKAEFIKQGFKKLYSKINVEVYQGRVLYTGSVESDQDIINAIDIAWSQIEVKEVINELSIADNKINSMQYAKDTWITTRIKSSIFTQRDIKFVNYTIVTSNNIVYLFGIARSDKELDHVSKIAASVKGVEKVISHVLIKDS